MAAGRRPGRRGHRCPRWPTCRSVRRSGRSSTRSSSTPTPRPRTSGPSCSGTSTTSGAGGRSPLDREELADALVAVCDSPLGPLVGATLREIPLADRLREMDFELPLAGGDHPGSTAGDVRLGDLAPIARAPPAGRRPGARLRGDACAASSATSRCAATSPARSTWCSGSGPTTGRATWWSTTRPTGSGPRDEPLTALSYRPEALDAAMGHSDYPLQALLYATVLHRFLRWRQPGYDPEQHLGGVLYLYLRGMCGPDTPLVDGAPVRGVRLASAGRAGRGAVRPARRSASQGRPHDRALRADRASTTGG